MAPPTNPLAREYAEEKWSFWAPVAWEDPTAKRAARAGSDRARRDDRLADGLPAAPTKPRGAVPAGLAALNAALNQGKKRAG